MMDSALAEYNHTFKTKIESLTPLQKTCLESILKGDTMCILPTGYGKSLLFEILPFVCKHTLKQPCCVLIIAPLNSIIHQEIQKLGDKAIHITGEVNSMLVSRCENDQVKKLKAAEYNYIFSHPENVIGKKALNEFFMGDPYQINRIFFLFIDEAHCILEWGTDFRPEFLNIFKLRSLFPNATIVALSATVTKEGQKEICTKLLMKSTNTICSSPTRENTSISLSVLPRPSFAISAKHAYDYIYLPLLYMLRNMGPNFPLTIVYCNDINWAGYGYELAKKVLGEKLYLGEAIPGNAQVTMFHSSLEKDSDKVKNEIMENLQKPPSETRLRMVFATIALGMGADLRHVQRVVHAGCPKTLETYVQEIGRAGRSGRPASAVMICNKSDSGKSSKEMKEYCRNEDVCRRNLICKYFGVTEFPVEHVECCDICDPEISKRLNFDQFDHQKIEKVRYAIRSYVKLDASGELQEILSEDTIDTISRNFEFFKVNDRLENTFNMNELVSHSVANILSHF